MIDFRLRLCLLLIIALLFGGCSTTPEQQAARAMEQGKKFFEQKDYARAILNFRNAAKLKPQDAEVYYQLGMAFLAAGDLRSGVLSIRRATELNPKHAQAQTKFAEIMATSSEKQFLEDAELRIKEVLAILPDSVEAMGVLAMAEWKLGKKEDAEKHLREAFAKNPSHKSTVIALAQMKMSQADLSGAETILKQAVAAAPNSAELSLALAQFYGATRRLPQAEQEIRRTLNLSPKDGEALTYLMALQLAAAHKDDAEVTSKRIAELPDSKYKPVYGAFLMENGKASQAIPEFERLLRAEPDNRLIRSLLVRAYLLEKRSADIEKVFAAALKKNPKDSDALLMRANFYIVSGKLDEAQEDLNQVIRFQSNSGEAHYLLAGIHQRRGATARQKQELDEALRAEPHHFAARVQFAGLLIAEKAAQAALDLLDVAPPSQKKLLALIIQRNWALYALGKNEELQKSLDEVMKTAFSPDLYQQKALLQLKRRDFIGSRQTLTAALQRNPEDARALELLGVTYASQKQIPAATQAVVQHAAQHPQSARLRFLAGRWLLASNELEKAKTEFAAAKALDPATVGSDLALGEIAIRQKDLNTARKHLKDAVSMNERYSYSRLMLASVEEVSGNVDAALEQYRAVLKFDSGNIMALNNLAYRLAESGKNTDEALALAEKAKELSPKDADVENTLGWVLYQKGLYSIAVRHLESAKLQQPSARRTYHLAMAYQKAGDPRRARQTLQAALKLDPNIPEAKTAQQLIGQ